MSEKSKFFSSQNKDRQYTSDDFVEYFRGLVLDGIQFGNTDSLKASNTGLDMNTTISPGACFIQGYQYILTENTSLNHDNADATNNRIDRIVLRLDTNMEVRSISLVTLKGTPDVSPVAPTLTQHLENTGIYEYPLAQVLISAGQSFINSDAITNESHYAKILNPRYRQIIIRNIDPDPNEGQDGDIFIKY